MSNGFKTMRGSHGKWSWGCVRCGKEERYRNASDKGRWNNAQKVQCSGCGDAPSNKCLLWGEGPGAHAGKWKPWDDLSHPRLRGQPSNGGAGSGGKEVSPTHRTAELLEKKNAQLAKENRELKAAQAKSKPAA